MRAFLWLRDIGTLPTDSHDERLPKRLQVVMAAASMPTVGLWGLLFVAQGHAHLALWHLGYLAATLAMLLALGWTKRMAFFRLPHTLLVMLSPFGLHWQTGGYRGSGGAILWCLLSPIAAMMFLGARRSLPLFLGVMGLGLLGWVREGPLSPSSYELTPDEIKFHFAFNTIGFTAFLYLSTSYFVSRVDFEVVAGVIGRSKFSYDLWGDTVNTASRMESHGAPGRVHVSEATRNLLGDRFTCVDRGVITVKGKGEMRGFWLESEARLGT